MDHLLNEKLKKASDSLQSDIQSVLFECPKCDCQQTEITGKQSYFYALGNLFLGFILAFIAPFIIFIKIIIYIGTFKFYKIYKMIFQELWGKYIVWGKHWLIVLTFGFFNITRVYVCEKCGKKWVV